MKQQKAFTTMIERLREQGRPSVNNTSACVYTGPNNLHCAVGIMLSNTTLDEIDNEDMNTLSVDELINLSESANEELELEDTSWNKTCKFWDDMQIIHDSSTSSRSIPQDNSSWLKNCETEWKSYAKNNELEYPEQL